MNHFDLEMEQHPDRAISDKILSVSQGLFDSVRNAPLSARTSFPTILRKNNFGLALWVTRKYAFLEVTTKLKARRDHNSERLGKYRSIFTSVESNKPAIFSVSNSRLCRFANLKTEGAAAVSLGRDFSFCVWDLENRNSQNGRESVQKADLLYVVGFGSKIHPGDAWQEFDSLIRVTISDWSNPK